MKEKRFLLLGLCAVLVLTITFASSCGDKAEPRIKGGETQWKELVSRTESYAEVWKNRSETRKEEVFVRKVVLMQEMDEFFEMKTPYTVFYINAVCLDAVGRSPKESFAALSKMVIREQAALWYAKEHDIEITDEKLNQWIIKYNAVRDQVQYQDACKAAGVSYEVFYRYLKRQYRMLCILDMAHEADEKIDQEAMTAEYQESGDYKKLEKLMENCADLAGSGEGEDLNQILAADIWY